MLKALTQYQEYTGDARVIPVIDRYFRYQLSQLPTRRCATGKIPLQDELLSVIWLYNRTGSAYLIDLARLLRKQGYDWMAQFANFQYTQRITLNISSWKRRWAQRPGAGHPWRQQWAGDQDRPHVVTGFGIRRGPLRRT